MEIFPDSSTALPELGPNSPSGDAVESTRIGMQMGFCYNYIFS